MNKSKKNNVIKKILNSIETGDENEFQLLLEQTLDMESSLRKHVLQELFKFAIEHNAINILKHLIDIGVTDNNNDKTDHLNTAILNKNKDIVELLIKTYNLDKPFDKNLIPDEYNWVMDTEYNDVQKIRIYPLMTAAQLDDSDIARDIFNLLLPVSCPEKMSSLALYAAVTNNNKFAMERLIDVSNLKMVEKEIKTRLTDKNACTLTLRRGVKYFNGLKALKDKKMLSDVIDKRKDTPRIKKERHL